MSLGLAVIFWVTASLGKKIFAAFPVDRFPLLWRSELGFVAVMALWWLVHPTLLVGSAFWLPAAMAATIEVLVMGLVWAHVFRRQQPLDLADALEMLRRLR